MPRVILVGVLFALSSISMAIPTTATPQAKGDQTVYVTKTGRKYHVAGCRYLSRSQYPMKLKDAVNAGYTPCSVCNPPTLSEDSGRQTNQAGNPDAKVWVNTKSGVYHCPGTRWYGNTKAGEYMTQKQAQEKGNRPAYGKVCQ
jgi:hypothetical protein